MPRFELPAAADGTEQWMEMRDRDQITRKELRGFRLAWSGDGTSFREERVEGALSQCLVNWQIKTLSGDQVRMPTRDVKDVIQVTANIPSTTWSAIEEIIYGKLSDQKDLGYIGEVLDPTASGESDPQEPSTG